MRRRHTQLTLGLRASARWGGARAGAGRKPGTKSFVRHGKRDRFRTMLPAHVTLRMRDDCPSLRTVPIVRAIERTFAAGCARSGFRLVHYSLQGNHAHLIVEARDHVALGCGMKAIGARLARAVNRIAKRSGRVLADRYHARPLKTPKEVRNARRHTAAKTAHAVRSVSDLLDPASSARWFDGWKLGGRRPQSAIAKVATRPPAVAAARTWLLNVGWRRHGLLDPTHVPGPA